jgi:hypothetical protein
VKLALLLETRACVALAQGLEGRPMLGELLRDTFDSGNRAPTLKNNQFYPGTRLCKPGP